MPSKNLTEKIYTLEVIQPQLFYGPNNEYLELIKSNFPSLKFVARGNEIKISGDEKKLEAFAGKLKDLETYFEKTGEINEHVIHDLFKGTENKTLHLASAGQTLVIGTRGQKIAARTGNQKALVQAAGKDDIIFAIGPAGTGKTFLAVASAVDALERSAKNLSGLVYDILDHKKLVEGNIELNLQPIQLSELVKSPQCKLGVFYNSPALN